MTVAIAQHIAPTFDFPVVFTRQAFDPANAVLADILASLGVDPGPVLTAAGSAAIKAKLRQETEEAARRDIFGSPSFVTAGGELFWGNDRLEQALAWAKRAA